MQTKHGYDVSQKDCLFNSTLNILRKLGACVGRGKIQYIWYSAQRDPDPAGAENGRSDYLSTYTRRPVKT
jgi:hypothetical protein